jgi:hypothetical protein
MLGREQMMERVAAAPVTAVSLDQRISPHRQRRTSSDAGSEDCSRYNIPRELREGFLKVLPIPFRWISEYVVAVPVELGSN